MRENDAREKLLIAGKSYAEWQEHARRDDALERMVPSDLRLLVQAAFRAHPEPTADAPGEASELVCALEASFPEDGEDEVRIPAKLWSQILAALRPQSPDALALLREVRACRTEGRTAETVHGPRLVGKAWAISKLTALLPRIDAHLFKTGDQQ